MCGILWIQTKPNYRIFILGWFIFIFLFLLLLSTFCYCLDLERKLQDFVFVCLFACFKFFWFFFLALSELWEWFRASSHKCWRTLFHSKQWKNIPGLIKDGPSLVLSFLWVKAELFPWSCCFLLSTAVDLFFLLVGFKSLLKKGWHMRINYCFLPDILFSLLLMD